MLGVSKSTLSFHLKKLTSKGLLRTSRDEVRNIYSLPDKEGVVGLLITYKDSFLDAAVDHVLNVWLR